MEQEFLDWYKKEERTFHCAQFSDRDIAYSAYLHGKESIPVERVVEPLLAEVIDELPENLPLYKDSGLWQIRSDDMENVLFQQECDQSFEEFISRYLTSIRTESNFSL